MTPRAWEMYWEDQHQHARTYSLKNMLDVWTEDDLDYLWDLGLKFPE